MNGQDTLINGLNNIRFKGVFILTKKTILEEQISTEEQVTEEQPVETIQLITKEQVNERLELINTIVKEEHPVIASEKAHVEQDRLIRDVLEGIANGAEDPAGIAAKALEVFEIEFTRWYK
jgi:hypothetical protein